MKQLWSRRSLAIALSCLGLFGLVAPASAGGGGQVAPTVRKAPVRAGEELLGEWEVIRVLTDLRDQAHASMRPNDALALYRGVTITRDKVRFGEEEPCSRTNWLPLATTWQGLFDKTGMRRAPNPSAPTRAKPKDYDLDVTPAQRVQAFLICPAAGLQPSKLWADAGWMVLEAPDSLVMRYAQRVLVVLRRRASDEKPVASFGCDKVSSQAEKAICSDRDLAAWDRSVAEALRQVLDYKEGDAKAEVLRDQLQWRVERDKCGSESRCLKSAMRSRVVELNQQ